ncbi:DUF3419 family protein [Desulfomonile tiedjei]|uniref:S-adenosylmethionine:diacylglycerol 3-amino-3-carboxypropyl transferase n=1 Tax=Desulfomonile tiedjei (strain ATCC 49306 / DSM 6799 / DCB-1) TaxID=706587 RepID=I4C5R8_DESTA|nr:BtaA family protein [Desulfomonile tiedjei]AFM24909.1 S-adenosylmethionine:diacylglycerol 3-amino-3-carboxypropyl transferase [Desulfomonile tiedjei DSM 6799]
MQVNALSEKLFGLIHGNSLVYNTCWEDPRIDRMALDLTPQDRVMVITSAGCNALDYALKNPDRIYAVDMNPRQNFLLQFKIAGIRSLDFENFFSLFGNGYSPQSTEMYRDAMRRHLSPDARRFWDRKISYFSGKSWRSSFYFRGSAGLVAKTANYYIDYVAKARNHIEDILEAPSLEVQQRIYEDHLKRKFFSPFVRQLVKTNLVLYPVGVPAAQKDLLNRTYSGGVEKLLTDCLDYVFSRLPLSDNYFWQVYLNGKYSKSCCPEYLRPENFNRLKEGLVDKIEWFNGSVSDFLSQHDGSISRFVLLDHMDWLAANYREELYREWQWLVRRASSPARVIWRSAATGINFVNPLEVQIRGKSVLLKELLSYQTERAATLHQQDRVHMYSSFFIADLPEM